MRASELIEKLHALVKEHGDLPVVVSDNEYDSEVEASKAFFEEFEFAKEGIKTRVFIR